MRIQANAYAAGFSSEHWSIRGPDKALRDADNDASTLGVGELVPGGMVTGLVCFADARLEGSYWSPTWADSAGTSSPAGTSTCPLPGEPGTSHPRSEQRPA